jgi:hypothetical protein
VFFRGFLVPLLLALVLLSSMFYWMTADNKTRVSAKETLANLETVTMEEEKEGVILRCDFEVHGRVQGEKGDRQDRP